MITTRRNQKEGEEDRTGRRWKDSKAHQKQCFLNHAVPNMLSNRFLNQSSWSQEKTPAWSLSVTWSTTNKWNKSSTLPTGNFWGLFVKEQNVPSLHAQNISTHTKQENCHKNYFACQFVHTWYEAYSRLFSFPPTCSGAGLICEDTRWLCLPSICHFTHWGFTNQESNGWFGHFSCIHAGNLDWIDIPSNGMQLSHWSFWIQLLGNSL